MSGKITDYEITEVFNLAMDIVKISDENEYNRLNEELDKFEEISQNTQSNMELVFLAQEVLEESPLFRSALMSIACGPTFLKRLNLSSRNY